MKLVILSLTVALLAPTILGQDQLCSRCNTTGKVPSKFAEDPIERNVLHCTVRLRRDPTLGLGWTPCEKCKAPSLAEAARKEFDANAVAVKAWLAEQDKIGKELSAEFETVETEHFVLTWGCGSFTAEDRHMYDQHTGMHLFASRLETFYHDFYSNLQVGDEMLRNRKHHVYVFKEKKTIIKASQLYIGMTSDTCALAAGDPSIFATWWDKDKFRSEKELYRHLVHHVSHLLLAVVHLKALLDEVGFVHEGLGHYSEIRLFGESGDSCGREGAEEELPPDFESEVALGVRLGKFIPFATIAIKRTTDLHGLEHCYAWSYLEFLMSTSAKATRDLIVRLKDGKDLRTSLKELFGFTFAELQEAWLKHVKDTYKEKSATAPRRPKAR